MFLRIQSSLTVKTDVELRYRKQKSVGLIKAMSKYNSSNNFTFKPENFECSCMKED